MNCAQIWRPSCLLIHQYQGAGALWAEPVPSSARAAPSISACKNFFINYVTKYGFAAFGWYRIIVGIIIIACSLLGMELQMVD